MILGNTILTSHTTNPAKLAMYLASLDELTGGRVVCGISARLAYMDRINIPAKRPLTRTNETIDLICWSILELRDAAAPRYSTHRILPNCGPEDL